MTTPFRMTAKTLFGLEKVLAAELRALGAEHIRPGRRLVEFTGDQRLLYRANLECRTAIRILKPIHHFFAESEQGLYDGIQKIDWSEHLDPEGTLTIDPIVFSSFTTHSLYAAQLSKDAIVDQFRERTSKRPSVDRHDPDLRIHLYLNNNQASVFLDASGNSLHKRGYRTATNEAPINEVLAAGILQLAHWQPDQPMADFMCGSGTFLIEAAMLARRIAPGLVRKEFAYMWWKDFDATLHQTLLDEAKARVLPRVEVPLLGSDLDEQVIPIAQQNAANAGVADDIRFSVKAFDEARPMTGHGLLVTNPPYDERLKLNQIGPVYTRIGYTLRNYWQGHTAFIISGNPEASQALGMRPSQKTQLFNGPLECELLKFEIRKPEPARTRLTRFAEEAETAAKKHEQSVLNTSASKTATSPPASPPAGKQPETPAPAEVIREPSPLNPASGAEQSHSPATHPDAATETATSQAAETSSAALTSPPPTSAQNAPPALNSTQPADSSDSQDHNLDRDQDHDWEYDDHSRDDEGHEADFEGETAPSPAQTASWQRRPWQQQAAELTNRLKRMGKHWAKWARRQGITCYRLYDRDIPEIPLAIDWYEGHLHIAEYLRPNDRTDLEHQRWLANIAEAAAAALDVPNDRVFLKHRLRQRGQAQYQRQAAEGNFLQVQEAGHTFRVNLADYLDTGLFLDHRLTRSVVQQQAQGKRVLNLFAYTGSFSVYAAAGGALTTTTVDMSNTYLDWARENMRLNGFTQIWHDYVRADALSFARDLYRRPGPPFDLIVIDPPTFSNSKNTPGIWDVQRDHVEILNLLVEHLPVDGKIYFSTNFRKFRFEDDQLRGARIIETSRKTVPQDFRNKRIHRSWLLIRTEA